MAVNYNKHNKHKAIVVQAYYRPSVFQDFEAPRFQDNGFMQVVRLSALSTGLFYTPGNIPATLHYKQ
jgi:hypothetical protein